MNTKSKMKKTLKNQKVSPQLQFLRRFTAVETWLKPVTKINQKSPKKPCQLGGTQV